VDSTGQDPIYLAATDNLHGIQPAPTTGLTRSLYRRPTLFQYNVRGFQGPIPARDFHANVDTVSVKYVF